MNADKVLNIITTVGLLVGVITLILLINLVILEILRATEAPEKVYVPYCDTDQVLLDTAMKAG